MEKYLKMFIFVDSDAVWNSYRLKDHSKVCVSAVLWWLSVEIQSNLIKLIPWVKSNNFVFVSGSIYALFWCWNQRSAGFFSCFAEKERVDEL